MPLLRVAPPLFLYRDKKAISIYKMYASVYVAYVHGLAYVWASSAGVCVAAHLQTVS